MGWLPTNAFLFFKPPITERKKEMKIEELIALTQAGFTKNEIITMMQQNQQNQQMQQNQQSDGLLAAITNLTNTIQASNITGSGLQTSKNQPETADQIAKRMMEIMN